MVLGSGSPTVRHPTKKSAKTEAERLAAQHPGQEFVVMEALATVVKSDMHWEENDIDDSQPDDEVPF